MKDTKSVNKTVELLLFVSLERVCNKSRLVPTQDVHFDLILRYMGSSLIYFEIEIHLLHIS